MDPVTAALLIILESLKLTNSIRADMPDDVRRRLSEQFWTQHFENLEFWRKVLNGQIFKKEKENGPAKED